MPDSDTSGRPDRERLIEENPNVDPDQLQEAQELLEKLHREGVKPTSTTSGRHTNGDR
jgi:hypothetical protein